MSPFRLVLLTMLISSSLYSEAQIDSTIQSLQQIPLKYINQVDKKIDKYSSSITNKTLKTLAKLSKWENKIHALLTKVNPQAAENLFGNNQATFASVLKKLEDGKSIAENYQAKYDEYRDKLTSSMVYLQRQKDSLKSKLIDPINTANHNLDKF